MNIDNADRIKRIKRIFYLICVVLVASALALIILDQPGRALIAGAVLVVWFLVFQSIDFQYIQFIHSPEKITLRFYPAVKFGRKDYQTIEFPAHLLHNFSVEKSLFGLVNDLVLRVKTKRGVAEYPSVSMAALSKADQQKIKTALSGIK